MTEIPSREDLFLPTVKALQLLGGSGTTDEIYGKVVQTMNLPEEVAAVLHGDTGRTGVEYRRAWSRTYLKKCGLVENSSRGVWSLTPEAKNLNRLDPREIVRTARAAAVKGKNGDTGVPQATSAADDEE